MWIVELLLSLILSWLSLNCKTASLTAILFSDQTLHLQLCLCLVQRWIRDVDRHNPEMSSLSPSLLDYYFSLQQAWFPWLQFSGCPEGKDEHLPTTITNMFLINTTAVTVLPHQLGVAQAKISQDENLFLLPPIVRTSHQNLFLLTPWYLHIYIIFKSYSFLCRLNGYF